ncbi:MAG: hypothetical protein IPO03_03500 [Bacteroidetes bacterium]|nr:hypothetical protein [Bacteroidota bacterium]
MKTIQIIAGTLLILLSIWSFNGFNFKPIFATLRWMYAYTILSPKAAIAFFIGLTLIIYISVISIKRMRIQSIPIESVLTKLDSSGLKVLNFQGTSDYLKISKSLNNLKFDNKRTDDEFWNDLIESYRYIYDNLPVEIKEHVTTNQFSFHKKTQIKVIKIKDYNESLFFVLHDSEKNDKSVEIEYFDSLPDIQFFLNFTNNLVHKKTINEYLINLKNFKTNKVSLHNINGYGLAKQREDEAKLCLCGYLPYNIANVNYTGILEDALLLKGLRLKDNEIRYKFMEETVKENLLGESKSIPVIIYHAKTSFKENSDVEKFTNCLKNVFLEVGWQVTIETTNNYPKTGITLQSFSAEIQPTNDLFIYLYNAMRDAKVQINTGGGRYIDPNIEDDRIEIYIGLSEIWIEE